MEQIRIVRQTLQKSWIEMEKIKRRLEGFMIESYLADGRQNQPERSLVALLRIPSWLGKYRGLGRRDLCYLDKISEKDGVGGSQPFDENDSWTRN